MLEIKVSHRLEDLPPDAWDALVGKCPDSTIFQSRAWIDPWWAAFKTAHTQLWILSASEHGQMVGVAPLFIDSQQSTRGRPTLSWLGLGHSDYHTFPAIDAAPRIVDALLDAVAHHVPADVAIDLPEIPQFSALATCLAQRASTHGSGVFPLFATACPRLLLDAEAAARVSSKKSVKRSEQKLRELGSLRFERLTQVSQVEPLLESFFSQHVSRWAGTHFPSLFRREENRRFYRDILQSLAATGQLQYCVLWLGDRPIAQHFGMISRGQMIWYKPTFDLELAKYSPGEVLLKHLIVDAAGQGLQVLDFTRGDEPFKARFATAVTYNTSFSWERSPSHRRHTRWSLGARRAVRRLRAIGRSKTAALLPKPARALVLDAQSTAGVEVLQSLGRASVEVHIASSASDCLAYRSRYVARRFEQPLAVDREGFANWLRQRNAEDGPYSLIVPTTENSLLAVGALPEDDPLRQRAMLARPDAMEMALSKESTWDHARSVGVPVPRSRLISSWDEVPGEVDYPLVLKPVRSLVKSDSGHQRLSAIVVRNAAERETNLRRLLPLSAVQEQAYFGGRGLGVECLYDRGQLVWTFVHERIHELPLTGGGSSYRRSRPPHAEAIWAAKRLLDGLSWHGVVMVEFKLDRDGRICLMEINPRFWGSLALAIDAGVDFPNGLWRLATGSSPGPQPDYRHAYFTRHLAMDVDWMKENWRASHDDPLLLTQPRMRSVLEYARPLLFKESHDHFSWRDPAVYATQFIDAVSSNAAVGWQRLIHKPLFERRMRRQSRRVMQAAAAGRRAMKSVLFLCYGNICRSPFADRYARGRDNRLVIDSAGFHATGNRPTPEHVVSAANALGVQLADRRSKVVDADMIAASDLIVVMDEDNLRRTLAMQPAAAGKVVMLGAIGGLDSVTIEDPYSMTEEEARKVLADIMKSIDRLIEYSNGVPQ